MRYPRRDIRHLMEPKLLPPIDPDFKRKQGRPAVPGGYFPRPMGGSKKRRKLLTAVIHNPDATQAELAKKSGMCINNVRKTLYDPRFKKALEHIMEARPDLCRDARLDALADGLQATTRVLIGTKGRTREVKDLKLRLPYLELACKMAGDLKPLEDSLQGDKVSLALVIVNERLKRGLNPLPDNVVDVTPEPEQENTNGTI